MTSIKLTITRGGYSSGNGFYVSSGEPDSIVIDVPIPDRAGSQIMTSEYLQLVETTFDKTAELVDVVRGTSDEVVDADVAEDDEVSA